jgi:hypothetical protein
MDELELLPHAKMSRLPRARLAKPIELLRIEYSIRRFRCSNWCATFSMRALAASPGHFQPFPTDGRLFLAAPSQNSESGFAFPPSPLRESARRGSR